MNKPMSKSKFKSDDRPSDTKSVSLHKERDARLLGYVQQLKVETEFWRRAGYFYLDFMEWLALQEGQPEPGRPFVYYQNWLESRQPTSHIPHPTSFDPESIAAAILPGMREVLEAVLSTALTGWSVGGLGITGTGAPPVEVEELADLFSSELVLE